MTDNELMPMVIQLAVLLFIIYIALWMATSILSFLLPIVKNLAIVCVAATVLLVVLKVFAK